MNEILSQSRIVVILFNSQLGATRLFRLFDYSLIQLTRLFDYSDYSIISPKRFFAGGHRGVVIPVPIPNTEVKGSIAEGSAGLARARVGRCRLFYFYAGFFYFL